MTNRWISILLLVVPASLFAQQEWTIDDVITQESISQIVFSPDGNMVAWTKRRASEKKDRFVTDLYLSRLQEHEVKEIQLTRTDDSDRNPVFSADGSILYFLSSRGKGKDLWAIHTMGGEAYSVHTFQHGISSIRLLNDSMMAYVSTEGKTLYQRRLEERQDDVIVVEDSSHQEVDRLFAFHLKQKAVRRLTTNVHPLSTFELSENGRWIVTGHELSPHYGSDGKPAPTYFLWDLETGNHQKILQKGYLTPGSFRFVKNGFYFRATQTSDPEWEGAGISLLYYYDLFSGTISPVNIDWSNGLSGAPFLADQQLIVSLADGTYTQVGILTKSGASFSREVIKAEEKSGHLSVNAVSDDGKKAILTYSTASTMPEVYLASLIVEDGQHTWADFQPFTHLNQRLTSKKTARSEVISWTGALDEPVTGILIYPQPYEPGRKYPLLVAIHGGPSGVDLDKWSDRWAYPHQLLAQEGMFILKPNYHGSSNHGQAFVESIKKHYYEYELPDILSGIEYLEGRGMVDRDSLAVLGWSNGAILTTMLTVEHPDLFKVAAAGAGDVNWSSDYGTCGFGVTFDQSYFGGAPWDDVDGLSYNPAYILKSPLFEMEKVTTPTLIHHGSEDRAVPRDQGWEYYRALQQVGKAPVRFLWYPGQPHGLRKLSHQRRKVQEEIQWIQYYLFGKDLTESEVMKPSSPLTERKELMQSQHVNGLWGVQTNGILIPETHEIAKDSMSIGRFEVTNAQFAAFKEEWADTRADRVNHPVTGITIDQALAYCTWLSDITGDQYRLPNSQEANSWAAKILKASGVENTLRYWAGYEITVDEADVFLQEIEGNTPLTLPVGSFPPVKIGSATVYDLGGNVSEWVQSADHTSTMMGFGFMDFADQASPDRQRHTASIGLRIVKE